MMNWFRKFRVADEGATAVEYGLILALVVLAAMGAIVKIANSTISMWGNVADQVSKS
jgi:pilus assembly protein Flp/PilA